LPFSRMSPAKLLGRMRRAVVLLAAASLLGPAALMVSYADAVLEAQPAVIEGTPCGPFRLGAPAAEGLWAPGWLDGVVGCAWREGHADVPAQCCCAVAEDKLQQRRLLKEGERCLPHAIVVGAQKSGSTVLMSYLLSHPSFSAPRAKVGVRGGGRAPGDLPSPTPAPIKTHIVSRAS
jgi:hypothetical protein